ncbi:MAG: hypothetical protein HY556_04605 [Euryarchaeota archaeon]|nr:hypothetical protein [Euryarchaeota archaeon]
MAALITAPPPDLGLSFGDGDLLLFAVAIAMLLSSIRLEIIVHRAGAKPDPGDPAEPIAKGRDDTHGR